MLVNSFHSALKHAVEAFKGISVNVSPDILASAVRYEVMGRKMHVQMSIPPGFVCHDMRPAGDVRLDDQKQDRRRRARDVEGTRPAPLGTPLYKSHHCMLVGKAAPDLGPLSRPMKVSSISTVT